MPRARLQFLSKRDKIHAMFEWKGICAAGAVFDLDGTLIDSMEIWREIDEEFFAKRGMPVPAHYQEDIAHLGFRDVAAFTVKNYLPHERVEDMIAEWNEMCRQKYGAKGSGKYFKPDARRGVLAVGGQGVRLCVATASSPERSVPALKEGGIYGAFEGFFTVDDAGRNKSFPDIFLMAAERLGLPPADCVAFEDSLTALRAAKRAGMQTVAVYDKSSEGQTESLKAEADAFVYAFSEFFEIDQKRGI